VIGLRHYSFHRLVSEAASTLKRRSVVHDPSSISILFRFLLEEEKINGVLLHQYIHKWISVFLGIIISAVVLFGAVETGLVGERGVVFSVLSLGGIFGVFLWKILVSLLDTAFVAPFQRRMRRLTEKLVGILGEPLFCHMIAILVSSLPGSQSCRQ
jgi:hypothetical protein